VRRSLPKDERTKAIKQPANATAISRAKVTAPAVITETTATTIETTTKYVALDTVTDIADVLARFEDNKKKTKDLEKEYESLKSDIYTALGYQKIGTKWVGVAEEGTLAGVSIVKVEKQIRNNFNKEDFLMANPELLPEVERFTTPNEVSVLKTVR
jgi:hypothetical protein